MKPVVFGDDNIILQCQKLEHPGREDDLVTMHLPCKHEGLSSSPRNHIGVQEKKPAWAWRDGSVLTRLENAYSSCGVVPTLRSSSPQPPITPCPGDLIPSFGLRQQLRLCVRMLTQTHEYTY